jgi:hypothetical protein
MKGKFSFSLIASILVVLVVLVIAGSRPANAQSVYATVHGTVTDPTGAVVPNATVTALDTSKGISTQIKTDSKGYYVFPQLALGGPYTITISANGFQQYQTTDLTLVLNDNREVSAILKIGSNAQTVQVEAASVQVETSDTQLKTDISSSTIEDLPLLGRNVVLLQKTAPGVVESSDRFGTFSTNGSQTPQNSFLVDGTDVNDGPLQQAGVTPNPDALGEIQIISSTLNPEYSRNSGAIVSESIKSGSNAFHGDGFEFYRDTFLNTIPYHFSPTASKPPYHQNLYGGTLGGPVLKDKLFFFLAYQGYKNVVATQASSDVFSPSVLAGNFAGVGGSGIVPFSFDACTKGELWSDCYPSGNATVSPTEFNSIAVKLNSTYVPPTNGTLGGNPVYFFNSATNNKDDQGIVRIDGRITPNDSLWASSIFESHPSTEVIPFTGASIPGFGETDARHIKIFNASYTHTFSPTTVNELRAGYFRFNYAAVYPSQIVSPSSFGFNITPQDTAADSLPVISILNGPTLGFSTNGPQPRKDMNYDFADNFTKILSNHNLKFGAHIEKFVVSNPFYADNTGDYGFGAAGAYSSGNQFLDFFLGIPDSYNQQSGGFIDARSWEYYLYAQDNWKVSPSLTFNYGLAWDTQTPTENTQFAGIGVTCFSLSTQTSTIYPGGPPGLTYPGDKGCSNTGGPTTKWGHLAPRIGIAWSPEDGPSAIIGKSGQHDFSVRMGFGIYYNRDQEEGSLQNLSSPPFSKASYGAGDFAVDSPTGSGNPSFANPFADIYTGTAEASPFPFTPPAPHSQINWLNFGGLDINAFDPKYTPPIIYNYNLNVQRALPGAMVLSVGYVGSDGHHLITNHDGNPITPAGHAACLASAFCSTYPYYIHYYFPQYAALAGLTSPVNANGIPYYYGVGVQDSRGASNYNSLQIQLQKAPTHGLLFSIAYTYAHGLDNSSGLESSGFNGRGINFTPGYEYLSYGDSDYDARQRLTGYAIYRIPVTSGIRGNRIADELLSGWNVSDVSAVQTGFPVTLMETTNQNSAWCDYFYYYYCADSPNTTNYHATVGYNPRKQESLSKGGGSDRTGHFWFDTTPFSVEQVGYYGNTKRNYFHGPGYNYSNLSLLKNFPLDQESRQVQLRLDTFNLFNHANFAGPSGNYDSSSFGQITSLISPGTGDPQQSRVIQLAAKIIF